MTESIMKAYELAKVKYAEIGVDTEKAVEVLKDIPVSVNCWQGDDVTGFESDGGPDGGIAATGNYPGKARTPEELMADLSFAMKLIPGTKKVNIHAIYGLPKAGEDRDTMSAGRFDIWTDWANSEKIGLDFNPTFFSHPKSSDGFTLAHPDAAIREFWIEHGIRSREISEYIGKKTGIRSNNNIWIPDGFKDIPYDRTAPRARLKESLDKIIAKKLDEKYTKDAVESKVFGLGAEAYTVGSHEFYMGYAAAHPELMLTMDAGHYHPTEVISDKISSVLLFIDEILLHVSRPVRWDSDHVVILDDELRAIGHEIIRSGKTEKINIALDYFDASINRVAAWAIGTRNTMKALLMALLEPSETLTKAENELDYTTRLAMTEELKTYPFAAVWDYYCEKSGVPTGLNWLADVRKYEKDVLFKRG